MTDDEYKEFLTFLFERYVRPRIPRIRHRFHHHMMEEWYYHLDQAARAAHVVRFIEGYCEDDDDVYRTFTAERLNRAVSDARYSLEFSNRTTEEAGFLDAFEDHTHEIIAHLQPSHIPEAEKEVLKDMGSLDPAVELRALVSQAKASLNKIEQSTREVSARQQLRRAEERLKETEQAPRKSRRWFKGLGQIAQGSSLSIADVALAVGALKFPVSPETQTWGAVASVATGLCTILSGIGDLRNE